MPELPEVETVRRTLERTLVGARVARVEVPGPELVVGPGDPPGGFYRNRAGVRAALAARRLEPRELLTGAEIAAVQRRGKRLAIAATDARLVTVQLGMTGRFALLSRPPDDPAHVHVIWRLGGRRRLAFIDPRRFGLIRLHGKAPLEDAWDGLGPDALTITAAQLKQRLAASTSAVKAKLLDQRAVAGVGNIYADEALFAARIHPETPCRDVTPAAWTALGRGVRRILARAIDARGSSIRDYADVDGAAGGFQRHHQVYGRAGAACRRCTGVLQSARVAQRTTVWCPRCQPRTVHPREH